MLRVYVSGLRLLTAVHIRMACAHHVSSKEAQGNSHPLSSHIWDDQTSRYGLTSGTKLDGGL